MYLAFHNEMARPESSDPVERESTRLSCVATSGGQTTMDLDWWTKSIPGYDTFHRRYSEYFGVESRKQALKVIKQISALSIISGDDPPIFMSYGMAPDAPVPEDPRRASGWKIHHVVFGVKLKERMGHLGIEADLKYPGAKTRYRRVLHEEAARNGRSDGGDPAVLSTDESFGLDPMNPAVGRASRSKAGPG